MAEAGFYYCGTDSDLDLVRCYYCRRELSGWEETDVPWEEHARRQGCPYMKLNKKPEQLTFDDQVKLEKEKAACLFVSHAPDRDKRKPK